MRCIIPPGSFLILGIFFGIWYVASMELLAWKIKERTESLENRPSPLYVQYWYRSFRRRLRTMSFVGVCPRAECPLFGGLLRTNRSDRCSSAGCSTTSLWQRSYQCSRSSVNVSFDSQSASVSFWNGSECQPLTSLCVRCSCTHCFCRFFCPDVVKDDDPIILLGYCVVRAVVVDGNFA